MLSPSDSVVYSNLLEQAETLRAGGQWHDFRPGVTAHEHVGYEHMFVLEGDQYDEHGSYPAGWR